MATKETDTVPAREEPPATAGSELAGSDAAAAEEEVKGEEVPLQAHEGEARLGAVTAVSEDMVNEKEVATWVQEQVQLEVARLKDQGARVIPVPVKSTAIVRDGEEVHNHIECDTGFDFKKVRQILLSPETACWKKPGYSYLNVLLFGEKPIPLLLPYMHNHQAGNTLKHWVFINNKGGMCHHQIDGLEDV